MATKKQDSSPRDFANLEQDIVQGLLSGESLSGKDGVLANLTKHVVDKAIEVTLAEFDARDAQEDSERKTELQTTAQEKLAALKQRKTDYEKMRRDLADSEETQVSLTDPDARNLMKKGRESLVGYNIQSVVDADQHLIVHVEATNTTDINALAGLAAAAKEVIARRDGAAAGAKSGGNAYRIHRSVRVPGRHRLPQRHPISGGRSSRLRPLRRRKETGQEGPGHLRL